ncbi:MAG TPA: GNAT family N-acyltransferase [Anaerolineae bacterium]|nr:GNAT family N-acyltransferase [Anaerolineae bacterium]
MLSGTPSDAPFKFNTVDHPRRLPLWLAKPLENLLLLSRLNQLYQDVSHTRTPQEFLAESLRVLDVQVRVASADRAKIPAAGPVVVVANHPFGLIEGMMLAHVLYGVRADVRVLTNYLLAEIQQVREMCIFVDPFDTPQSSRANLYGLKTALSILKQGQMLVVFPAGEVSHLKVRSWQILDPTWSEHVARLIRRSEATVLPAYFAGSNGLTFQLAGLMHPRLRTALLPRELLSKQHRPVELRFGTPLPPRQWQSFSSDRELIDYLRQRTYALTSRPVEPTRPKARPGLKIGRKLAPIGEAQPKIRLQAEIEALPGSHLLAESKELVVYYAEGHQIPALLTELGRLREIAFRGTGEGTGRALDLDRFDRSYLHLWIWHRERQEVVGAYRLGLTDQILQREGLKGLYTRTLFNYSARFIDRINPAIELGRSFVRPEYQRDYASLLMLWRGIGQFVMRQPKYKILFGPVSISSTYTTMSQALLVNFLRTQYPLPELAPLIRPKNPPRHRRREAWQPARLSQMLGNVEDLSAVIQDIEADQKGVPILLRHYLKLGARVLAFNVDPHFSNVLDALVLVDLTRTDPKVMARYVEKAQVADFLAYHQERAV